jgi:hypothetical protein
MRSPKWPVVLAAVLAIAGGAHAKTLATGAFFYSGSVLIDTICALTNVGKKPITLTDARIQNYSPGNLPPAQDDCSTAPLEPDDTCFFAGTAGVYGGGRIEVRGSAKSLRGYCGFYDAGGTAVQVLELR